MPYIAETTRSVLQTDYPDLEYILIDAGSSDGTLDHINRLQDHRVTATVIPGIRPYEAIAFGFAKATGDILAWINGDDLYYPWTVSCAAKLFTTFPDVRWITGLPSFLNAEGHCTSVGHLTSYPRHYIQNGWFNEFAFGNLQQESMFWRRSLYEQVGGLDLQYDLAADFELWVRMSHHAELFAVSVPLAAWRRRGTNRSLTGRAAYLREVRRVTANLPKLGPIKRCLCRTHMVTKHALRLLEWHKTSWLYFSVTESRWKRGSAIRPISRDSLQQLAMEFAARRRPASPALSTIPPQSLED
jgi:GT2 family glycosyltransferase